MIEKNKKQILGVKISSLLAVGVFLILVVISLISVASAAAINYAQFNLNVKGSNQTYERDYYNDGSLVAYYPFDGDANDSSIINKNDGTLVGGATFVNGYVGKAVSLDGAGDYVNVPDNDTWHFGSNNFSIGLWAKFSEIKDSMFISQQSGSNLGGFEFDYQVAGSKLIFSRNSNAASIERSWSPEINRWYYLALTRENLTYRMYVDGAQLGGDEVDSNPVADVNGVIRVGSYAGGGFDVKGLIDEVKVFDKALTEDEVNSEYENSIGGNLIPVDIAYYSELNVSLTDMLVTEDSISGQDVEPSGMYVLDVHYLNSSKGIINRKTAAAYFTIFSDPPEESNETYVSASFEYDPFAEYVRIYWKGVLLLEKDFKELACNNNSICENSYLGNETMFENYLSCPSDCNKYGFDGICIHAPGSEYSYNDHYCDPDCITDNSTESGVVGDCSLPNCNDGIKNQDETGIDQGGICDIMNMYCGDGICQENENSETCPADCLELAYCSYDKQFQIQKTIDAAGNPEQCQNDFECESNNCTSGNCVNINDMGTGSTKGYFVGVSSIAGTTSSSSGAGGTTSGGGGGGSSGGGGAGGTTSGGGAASQTKPGSSTSTNAAKPTTQTITIQKGITNGVTPNELPSPPTSKTGMTTNIIWTLAILVLISAIAVSVILLRRKTAIPEDQKIIEEIENLISQGESYSVFDIEKSKEYYNKAKDLYQSSGNQSREIYDKLLNLYNNLINHTPTQQIESNKFAGQKTLAILIPSSIILLIILGVIFANQYSPEISFEGNLVKSSSTGISSAQGSTSSLSEGLILSYSFDSDANDNSGNGNNGAMHGGAFINTSAGKYGGALQLNGNGAYLTTPQLASAKTISAWVNFNTLGGYRKVFRADGSRACFGTSANVWERCDNIKGSSVSIGQWYLVTLVEGTGIYVDGILEIDSTSGELSNESLNIGGPPFSEWMNGKVDELRVWNRSLSLTEVKALNCDGCLLDDQCLPYGTRTSINNTRSA